MPLNKGKKILQNNTPQILNTVFPSYILVAISRLKILVHPTILSIAGDRRERFMNFPRALVCSEMQTASI